MPILSFGVVIISFIRHQVLLRHGSILVLSFSQVRAGRFSEVAISLSP